MRKASRAPGCLCYSDIRGSSVGPN